MTLIAFTASVLLYWFSFPNIFMIHGFSPGGWLTAIPFLFILDGKPWHSRIALGSALSFFAHGLLFWWVMPLSWAGYLLFVLVLAVQGAIFSLLFFSSARFIGRWGGVLFLLYVPSAWVASEYARSWICGGFTWALGISQAPVAEFVQPARFGGVYAVSWCMMVFAAAVYMRVRRKGMAVIKDPASLMLIFFPVALWIAGSMTIAMDMPHGEKPLRVALIQPNITHADKINIALYNNNVSRHLALSKKSAQAIRPDVIVWPETALTDDIMRDALWRPKMEAVARNFNSYFIIGSAMLSDEGNDLNALLLLSPKGQWKDVYYKRYLVPFSEYLPSNRFSRIAARVSGMKSYHFLPGNREGLFHLDHPDVTLAVVICSEEAYPALFRGLAQKGAGLFVSVLNDGWFSRPEALLLHSQSAIFRAVETGRPLLRAANTGLSAVIDYRGRVRESAALQSEAWVRGDVYPETNQTFYGRFGDIFASVCVAYVIIIISGELSARWALRRLRRGQARINWAVIKESWRRIKMYKFLTLVLLCYVTPAYAGTVTLTTYYPSPSGEYEDLNVSRNLGIGGITPTSALSVNGNEYIINGSLGFNRNPADGSLPPGGNAAVGRYQLSPVQDQLQFESYNSSGTGTGVMVITAATGNVGIGLLNPAAKLEVAGDARFGCRSGFWAIGDGRICMEDGMRGPAYAHAAIRACRDRAPGCRVCTHTDFQQACGAGKSPYQGLSSGWYGDKANEQDWYATWDLNYCTENNDGPPRHATSVSTYYYRCCY